MNPSDTTTFSPDKLSSKTYMVRCLSVLIKVYTYNSKLRVHVHCTPRFFCARILVNGQIGKPGANIVNKSSYIASNGGVHRARAGQNAPPPIPVTMFYYRMYSVQ